MRECNREQREFGYPVKSTIDDILAGRHLARSC